jgi:hypothetical protein
MQRAAVLVMCPDGQMLLCARSAPPAEGGLEPAGAPVDAARRRDRMIKLVRQEYGLGAAPGLPALPALPAQAPLPWAPLPRAPGAGARQTDYGLSAASAAFAQPAPTVAPAQPAPLLRQAELGGSLRGPSSLARQTMHGWQHGAATAPLPLEQEFQQQHQQLQQQVRPAQQPPPRQDEPRRAPGSNRIIFDPFMLDKGRGMVNELSSPRQYAGLDLTRGNPVQGVVSRETRASMLNKLEGLSGNLRGVGRLSVYSECSTRALRTRVQSMERLEQRRERLRALLAHEQRDLAVQLTRKRALLRA